jgi:hypothetical protein
MAEERISMKAVSADAPGDAEIAEAMDLARRERERERILEERERARVTREEEEKKRWRVR